MSLEAAALKRTIAVVMPNYNHSHELRTSLGAIVTQTRAADEIVIVDDGSTDDSIAIIEGFARDCPALRLIRHERRQGVAAAVSRGLNEARSDYIILASADEKIVPEMTAEFSDVLGKFPQAQLGVSYYSEWFPETGEVRVHDRTIETGMWYATSDEPFCVSAEQARALMRRRGLALHANAAIFDRRALLDVGGFDPQLRWHSDWFAIYAVALRAGFCAVPKPLSWFRMVPSSYSAKGIRNRRLQADVMIAIIDKLRQPEFAYLRDALLQGPAAMSPFMRTMLPALLARPAYYPELFAIGQWWLAELAAGRRPAAWAKFKGRLAPLL
jgi:glycosyltransferase involved in cell wall biosynthesis